VREEEVFYPWNLLLHWKNLLTSCPTLARWEGNYKRFLLGKAWFTQTIVAWVTCRRKHLGVCVD